MFATDATVLLHIVCSSGVAEQASNSESELSDCNGDLAISKG